MARNISDVSGNTIVHDMYNIDIPFKFVFNPNISDAFHLFSGRTRLLHDKYIDVLLTSCFT